MDSTEINPIQLIQRYFNELEQLRGRALTARNNLIEKFHYDEIHDYRITIFEQIDRLLIYHDTNVILFLRYILHPQYVSTKHALIIFIQSVIESYYRAFCACFGTKVPTNFSKVYEALFNQYNIPKENDWFKANKILAKVRNTLHNNGIHTMPDDTVVYHGRNNILYQKNHHKSAGY